MTHPFKPGMAEATRLTRAGQLSEATGVIRAMLAGHVPARAAGEGPPQVAEPTVINGTFRRLDGPDPQQAESAGQSRPAGPGMHRARLGETLRWIKAGGMPAVRRTAPVEPLVPEGASFGWLTHAGACGTRDYRLYMPKVARSAMPASLPLIVMLHGCTQSPDDFAAGTGMNALAEEFGCIVAYPAQPAGANVNKCWNWFRPEDQARDRGEPALIAGIVQSILDAHPVDPSRVYVAGLSAGGAAAAILGAAYPDLFAAVGVHSGLAVGVAHDVASAFTAMRQGATGNRQPTMPPTIVVHGDADATVHPGNGAAVLAQAIGTRRDLRAVTARCLSAGGRGYRRTRHVDADGCAAHERWEIEGAGHAWAGGGAEGSHTDPRGPDASRAMITFFLQVPLLKAA